MPNWVNSEANKSSSSRKRWNIENKKSLQNLKYQLANDGNPDMQFDLAKKILEEDTEESAQGVHWLVKASEQNHVEALVLLNECFISGRGITADNETEVRNILSMSAGERAARRAASELFASLSNGAEYVTVEQLERKMREIYKLHKKKKRVMENEEQDMSLSNLEHRHRTLDEANHISEENLVSAAVNYSNGHLPHVNNALTISVPHPQSLDHLPFLHRPFFHPIIFFSLLYHRLIGILSSIPSMSSISQYQVLILLFIYAALSSDCSIFMFLPITSYYISLSIMLVSSFKMLKSKHEFIDFRIWSGLFLRYGDDVDADASENQYLRNNMKPYLCFFLAFALNLMVYPLIMDQWLPYSEVTTISFILTFVTLTAFMYTSTKSIPDFLVMFSFALNVLAKYPYELDSVVINSWRFLDLKVPAFSTFVIGNGIEFCLNCRGLLYILIPGFLIFLARRNNWQGIFQFLIPHCVTLAWLQISIISSQEATMFGLVRSALGLAGFLLFLPLFGIATLLIPVFAGIEWLSLTDSTLRIFATLSTSIIAIVGSCFMAASNRAGKYITFLQVLLFLIATVFLTYPYMKSEESYSSYLKQNDINVEQAKQQNSIQNDVIADGLNWETYYKYCLTPNSANSNRIPLQIRCTHLEGSKLRWEGTVVDIGIVDIQNFRADLIFNYLPEFLANHVGCFYGELNKPNCFTDENCEDITDYMENNLSKKCNLDKWNLYEYEIKVKVPAPTSNGLLNLSTKSETVFLRAQNVFGNFTQHLNEKDRIWFQGTLRSSLSNNKRSQEKLKNYVDMNEQTIQKRHTLVELHGIGCINCLNKELTSISIKNDYVMNGRLKDLIRGLKYLLNVLFNPLITFK